MSFALQNIQYNKFFQRKPKLLNSIIMIYTHVLHNGPLGVKSPGDTL